MISLRACTLVAGFLCGLGGINSALAAEPDRKAPQGSLSLFAPENLVAWCIVPFDNQHRTPAERIAMLKRLGFTQYAWDWRQVHLKDLKEEIRQSREAGVRMRAIWLWIEGGSDTAGHLAEGNRFVIDAVNEAHLPVEFWVGFHPNFFTGLDEAGRIQRDRKSVV